MISMLLVVAILLIGLAIAGFAIKILIKKGGEFKKSCSSMAGEGNTGVNCTCGGVSDERCENYYIHHVKKVDPLEE